MRLFACYRLLLEPIGTGGGGVETPPVMPPAVPPVAVTAPAPTAPVVGVTLTVEQYNTLKSKEAVADAAEAERVRLKAVADQAAVEAAKVKGDAIEAARLLTEQHNTSLTAERARTDQAVQAAAVAERRVLDTEIKVAVSDAMAGRTFIDGTVEDARTLLTMGLEAIRDPATGLVTVREKVTGKSHAEALKTLLDSPRFQVFQKPKGAGGGTGGSGQPVVPGVNPTTDAFMRHLANSGNTTAPTEYVPLGRR